MVRRLRTHPYAFYSETDMHCCLYHRVYAGGALKGCIVLPKTRLILLHKE